jgi:DNA ligase 4
MVGQKRVSVERKYDGEYCQVHTDLRKKDHYIKIFSKSGRDSTDYRASLRAVITECLSIGILQCKFKRQCIFEDDLLVWHEEKQQIKPFHEIRNHIPRAGHYLGCAADSAVGPTRTSDDHVLRLAVA